MDKESFTDNWRPERKTIIVDVYDPGVTKAPFKMIELERFTIDSCPMVKIGDEWYKFLSKLMEEKGYKFKFWSSNENNDIIVTVDNYGSPGSHCYLIDHLKDS